MYQNRVFTLVFALVLTIGFASYFVAPVMGAAKTSARIVVVIEENLLEVPASQTAENTMIQDLIKAGYVLVDRERAQALREEIRAQVLSATKLDKAAVQKIGEDLSCDFIIIGTAVADHYATSGVVKAYVANLDVRIIRTSTAEILATLKMQAKGRGYEPGPAIRAALEKATTGATKDMLAKNLLDLGPRVELFLIGLSHTEAENLALSMARNLGTGSRVVYYTEELSNLQVDSTAQATPEMVLERIRKNQDPPLTIVQVSGSSIRAKRGGPRVSSVSKDDSENWALQESRTVKEEGFIVGLLKVDPIYLPNVYPARLLNYSTGFAKVTLKNLSQESALKSIRVRISVPNYLSMPAERVESSLPPGEEREVYLQAVFDRDHLYENMQDQKAVAELSVSYEGHETESKRFEIEVHNRNAMNWDDPESIVNFVTPTDPVIKNFTSSVLSKFDRTGVQPCMLNLLTANAIFAALSSLPLRYVADPNSTQPLDYVHFPRETMERRSGDCDDLSVLFASCLESVGIPTQFVKTRDHIYLEFNTGMCDKSWPDICFDKEHFTCADGSLWIPLEMTRFCSEDRCFTEAWAQAAGRSVQLKDAKGVKRISFDRYTRAHPPFPLPSSRDGKTPLPENLHVKIAESMGVLYRNQEVALQQAKERYLQALARNPKDFKAKNRLGILLCKSGELQKAKECFVSLLEEDKSNPQARNNLGNTYLMMEKPAEAIDQYGLVSGNETDPEVLYNMGVACFLGKDRREAEANLRKAYSNLQIADEEKRMAWMLGVSDLDHVPSSSSEPWMEELKEMIYRIAPEEASRGVRSPSQTGQPAESQGQMGVSEVLWWKF